MLADAAHGFQLVQVLGLAPARPAEHCCLAADRPIAQQPVFVSIKGKKRCFGVPAGWFEYILHLMKTRLAVFLASILFLGCKAEVSVGGGEAVNVTVNCVTVAEPAVECELNQVQGKSAAQVCFDFSVTCANGAVVKAERACGNVAEGKISKLKIPGDKLTGMDKCGGEGAPVGKVENLKITGA